MKPPEAPAVADGDELASMSAAELHDFAGAHRRTNAMTMPQCPHEYGVRKNVADDDSFRRFVMTIRRCGNDEPFFALTHRYVDLGDFKYWTMGYTLAATIIINRAHLTPAARVFAPDPIPFAPKSNPAAPVYLARSRSRFAPRPPSPPPRNPAFRTKAGLRATPRPCARF